MTRLILLVALIAAACGVENDPMESDPEGGGKADDSAASGVQTLACGAGPHTAFKATLDPTGFDPGSGYFYVRNARVRDNFAAAELICTGHQLAEITCVGFWFGLGEHVAEVTTKDDGTGLTASHRSLKGDLVGPSADWPCTVQ